MTELEKDIKRELLEELFGTIDHTVAFNEVYYSHSPNTKPVVEVYKTMLGDGTFDRVEEGINNFINKIVEGEVEGTQG